jgi:hypothetical protein
MTQKLENEENLFSRWSRRKLDKQANNQPEEVSIKVENSSAIEVEAEVEEEPPPAIWLQDDADPDLKKAALSDLFHQPEFNIVDRMNEYDEDFTQFASLGNIVTSQMKHMFKLAEQKTRSVEQTATLDLDNIADPETVSLDEQTNQVKPQDNNNEENNIA